MHYDDRPKKRCLHCGSEFLGSKRAVEPYCSTCERTLDNLKKEGSAFVISGSNELSLNLRVAEALDKGFKPASMCAVKDQVFILLVRETGEK